MFRSASMTCCDMFLQPEAAFETISDLGDMCCVQFMDMNADVALYLRNYVSEVCRCAEMERHLRYIESEIEREKIPIPHPPTDPKPIHPTELMRYENMIEKWEGDITDLTQSHINLMQDLLEMKELRYVLTHIGPMFGDADLAKEAIRSKSKSAKGGGDISSCGRLYVMTGVVRRTRVFAFEMMLWRVSHGNIYYRQASEDASLVDPYTGVEINKVAFLAICQGEMLGSRMEKVFNGFRANMYTVPETQDARWQALGVAEDHILDLETVLEQSRFYRCKSLRSVSRHLQTWIVQVRKTKAIYHHMNMLTLDITKNCLIGQCWIPTQDLKRVQDTLEYCCGVLETSVPSFLVKVQTDEVAPTYHPTNKFTHGFQKLIDAYGDSKYREINPALYTVITFPFLFSTMFGDIGHAVILVIFALWMVLKEKKFMGQPGSEIWNIFFGGRYVMLLMGLFSLYSGFLYNDIFGVGFNLSDSMWKNVKTDQELLQSDLTVLTGSSRLSKPYIYGIDPAWKLSKNKIMVENSIKMKMSIILGVIHMLFGISLSLFNHLHFKKYYAIYLQFIPQFMFLFCIFFWLIFLIFYKWAMYYDLNPVIRYNSACAPPILILFIDMILLSTSKMKEPDEGCETYMFDSQKTIQLFLMMIGAICVPILLLGSPLYINSKNKKKNTGDRGKPSEFRRYQEKSSEKQVASRDPREVRFSDLMILQGVHTIEFVLSTISHTASYLRLWALSLAHGQLSEMLWLMVLGKLGLRDHSPDHSGVLKITIAFAIWAFFTMSILVVMEGLSAFLHTLRLHWVEFMSKFFIGEGIMFQPFCFKSILAEASSTKADAGCKSRLKKKQREDIKMENMDTMKSPAKTKEQKN